MRRQDNKALNDRHSEILLKLMMQPSNRKCCDCRKRDPRWASWNLGVFMCIRCSGIHRSLGTHISKVKSADLDTWTPEQIESMQKWGNQRANSYWEDTLKDAPSDGQMEDFIRSKYVFKKYAKSGKPEDYLNDAPKPLLNLQPKAPEVPVPEVSFQAPQKDNFKTNIVSPAPKDNFKTNIMSLYTSTSKASEFGDFESVTTSNNQAMDFAGFANFSQPQTDFTARAAPLSGASSLIGNFALTNSAPNSNLSSKNSDIFSLDFPNTSSTNLNSFGGTATNHKTGNFSAAPPGASGNLLDSSHGFSSFAGNSSPKGNLGAANLSAFSVAPASASGNLLDDSHGFGGFAGTSSPQSSLGAAKISNFNTLPVGQRSTSSNVLDSNHGLTSFSGSQTANFNSFPVAAPTASDSTHGFNSSKLPQSFAGFPDSSLSSTAFTEFKSATPNNSTSGQFSVASLPHETSPFSDIAGFAIPPTKITEKSAFSGVSFPQEEDPWGGFQ